jgi:hypothetical protein
MLSLLPAIDDSYGRADSVHGAVNANDDVPHGAGYVVENV